MDKIKFAIKHFGYDIFIFAGIVWFLIDSLIGPDYSHENLAALIMAWGLVMVSWFRSAEWDRKISKPKDIHIYLSNSMSPEEISKIVKRAVSER